MKDNVVVLPSLKPNETKKERFSVYLTSSQKQWLKKLSKECGFSSQSQYLSALLDREIANAVSCTND